jgi:hypothetical protein
MKTENNLKIFSASNILVIIVLAILWRVMKFKPYRDVFTGLMITLGSIQMLVFIFYICLRSQRNSLMEMQILNITEDSLARAQGCGEEKKMGGAREIFSKL